MFRRAMNEQEYIVRAVVELQQLASVPGSGLESAVQRHVATFWEFSERPMDMVTLMIARKDEKKWLDELAGSELSKGRVCGRRFQGGELIYRCKTCGYDDTCVVCADCFRLADHRGHTFVACRSGSGCCDCGDEEAWKPEGFCSVHKKTEVDTTKLHESLDPYTKQVGTVAFRCLLQEINKSFVQALASNQDLARVSPKSGLVFVWITNLCIKSSTILSLVVSLLGQSPPVVHRNFSHPTYYDMFLNFAQSKRTNFFNPVKELFHVLLKNYNSKTGLACALVRQYSKFESSSDLAMVASNQEDVHDISVQLLTTPTIAMHVMKYECAFSVLAKRLLSIWESFDFPKSLAERMTHEDIYSLRFHQCFQDLNYILSHPQNAKTILYESADDLGILFSVFKQLQWCDPMKRARTVHVSTESSKFKRALLLNQLCQDFVVNLLSKSETVEETSPLFFIPFDICLQQIMSWICSHPVPYKRGRTASSKKPVYLVSRDIVSYHLPLFRVFSSLIAHILKSNPRFSFQDLLLGRKIPNAETNTMSLLECMQNITHYLLITHALISQINAGMWKRNGTTVSFQGRFYLSVNQENLNIPDMFLTQVCLCVVNQDDFIRDSIELFELGDWLSSNFQKPEDEANQYLDMHKEYIRFLCRLVTNRQDSSTMTQTQMARYHIIHCLAIGDVPYSELQELYPSTLPNALLDEILPQVSTRKVAEGKNIFNLLPELWKEFNPYYLNHSIQNLQKCMETYQKCVKAKSIPHHHTIPSPALPVTKSIFSPLSSFLKTPALIDVIHTSLRVGAVVTLPGTVEIVTDSLFLLNHVLVNGGLELHHADTITRENWKKLNTVLEKLMEKDSFSSLRGFIEETNKLIVSNLGMSPMSERNQIDGTPKQMDRKRRAQLEREKILRQMRTSQKQFSEENLLLLGEEDKETEQDLCILCHVSTEQPLFSVSFTHSSGVVYQCQKSGHQQLTKKLNDAQIRTANIDYENCVPEATEVIETERPISTSFNCTVRSCGHLIHESCWSTYYISLVTKKSRGENYLGIHQIDLEGGMFLCPLCKRVSNTIVPHARSDIHFATSEMANALSSDETGDFVKMLSSVPTEDLSWSSYKAQCVSLINQLGEKQSEAGKIKITRSWPVLASTIANNLMSLDISHRSSLLSSDVAVYQPPYSTNMRNLYLASRVFVTGDNKASQAEWKQSLQQQLVPTECCPARPLLLNNAFVVFVRCVLLFPCFQSEHGIRILLDVMRVANLVQSVLYYNYSVPGSHLNADSFPEAFISLFPQGTPMASHSSASYAVEIGDLEVMDKPFLSSVSIFLNSFAPSFFAISEAVKTKEALEACLKVSSIKDAICNLRLLHRNLIGEWMKHLRYYREIKKLSNVLFPVCFDIDFKMQTFPDDYHDIIVSPPTECSICKQIPTNCLQCFTCGDIICSFGIRLNSVDEIYTHSNKCGAGRCVFLEYKSSATLVCRFPTICQGQSIYTDDHGEDDIGLSRGRPLRLSEPRSEKYRKMILNQEFDDYVTSMHVFYRPRLTMDGMN